jgi:hypothetical protein
MEPYPHHYSRRPKSDEPPTDPTLRFILDELQKMESHLGDRIEGRCGDLENRVAASEQRAEERLISLEMARSEVEQGHAAMEKQFDGLRLEVHRMNRFFERENMAGQQDKPSIISKAEAAGGTPLPAASADISDRGMFQTRSINSDVEWELRRATRDNSCRAESSRMSQGRLPKLQFPMFLGEDPQLWRSRCVRGGVFLVDSCCLDALGRGRCALAAVGGEACAVCQLGGGILQHAA